MFFITGCGEYDDKDIMKDLTAKVESSKGYYLEGEMEIINNEDVFIYDIKASYQEPDFYRVSLKNQINNHEQIILKNEEGVYVLTPSLNKSFKFQSEWPYNNSQVYLLQTLLQDLKNDNKKTFEETKNYYVFITKVNYPNNRNLEKQRIYLDKNLDFKEIQVLDKEDNLQIKMGFSKIDLKATFNNKYFALAKNMETTVIDEDVKLVSKIEDIIYPMYLPDNTYLESQEAITKSVGERVILNFDGDKPFVLVEETANKEEEFTIIPTYGDPYLIIDTYGSVTDNSISWISNGMEYYIASDVMNQEEIIMLAKSINALPVMK